LYVYRSENWRVSFFDGACISAFWELYPCALLGRYVLERLILKPFFAKFSERGRFVLPQQKIVALRKLLPDVTT
jgi:hypothetical protein